MAHLADAPSGHKCRVAKGKQAARGGKPGRPKGKHKKHGHHKPKVHRHKKKTVHGGKKGRPKRNACGG